MQPGGRGSSRPPCGTAEPARAPDDSADASSRQMNRKVVAEVTSVSDKREPLLTVLVQETRRAISTNDLDSSLAGFVELAVKVGLCDLAGVTVRSRQQA